MKNTWTVTKDKFLSVDEVRRLYKTIADAKDLALQRQTFHCHIRDYYILHTLLETGLRVGELVALRTSDFRSGSLIVRCGKGGKPRTVLLAKETQKMLANFVKLKGKALKEPIGEEDFLFLSERRKPYTTRGVRRRVKFWFAKCGFNPRLSVHSCRHSYVSHLIAKTKDLVLARDNAGHSSLAVTSIYSHVTKDDLGDLEIYGSA